MGKNLENIRGMMGDYNPYEAKMKKAKRLAAKWEKTGLLEDLDHEYEKTNMAILLENQARELIKEATETGQTAGSEEWSGVALPLVRKVFGEIASKEFVSVQPMNLPSGLVFYINFKYGDTKIPFTDQDDVHGTLTGAGSPTGGLYGAGKYGYSVNTVTGSATATTGSVSWADVDFDSTLSSSIAASAAGYKKLTLNSSSLSANYDQLGVRSFGISGGNIGTYYPAWTTTNTDGSTISFIVSGSAIVNGSYTVYYALQPTANTRGDFEYRGQTTGTGYGQYNIPELDLTFESDPIVAKTRRLKAAWTPEIAQDLNAYHAIDAEAELTSMLSEYITMEIDLEILDMLMIEADTTDYWSARPGYEYKDATSYFVRNSSYYISNKSEWFRTLGIKLQKVSNQIHAKTLRGGANFCVVSPDVATIFESMPGYNAAGGSGNQMTFAMGVKKVGELFSKMTVYKNPYMKENVILIGYRGNSFLETGAVFAPYIPLIMTPLIYDPTTLTPKKGVMTRYAKKMVRKEFFGKVIVSDLSYV